MPIRKDDYFCEIFIEKSCQKFANLSQDIAVVRQVSQSICTRCVRIIKGVAYWVGLISNTRAKQISKRGHLDTLP